MGYIKYEMHFIFGFSLGQWVFFVMFLFKCCIIFLGQVLQQQTGAIAKLGNVLKRDIRDMEIIMAEDTDLTDAS